ncbi:DUF2239 family protein [Gemmatimonas sp.]|uniref:DUF2239 family protein n=1 Tax=Gemmatimonas sp. TaxID=1962908 RepID=UPI0039830D7D
MTSPLNMPLVTAFCGHELLAVGPLRDVAGAVWRAIKAADPQQGAVLVFDDATGRVIDLEMRGDERRLLAHLDATWRAHEAVHNPDAIVEAAPRPRGRPKLGVVAREITLLPRHWEWLATQPGGASVALRKLVDAARRTHADDDRVNAARDAAYRFMHATAGDLSQFEEVIRALYRGDEARCRELVAVWPEDIRAYATRLAFPAAAD